ncbi:MAG: hypothetical protein AMXMBFR82_14690 [Candidatus Hydrogenedentota bacterium]
MNHSVSGRSLVQVVLGLIVVSTAVANSAIGLGLEFNADSSPDNGVTILENPERAFERVSIDGLETIAPLPHSDYFSRHGIVFQVERDWPGEPESVYVVVEHLDKGIALIDASASFEGKELPVTPVAGYTALDSGQIRRALFSMPEPPPPGTRFEVVGVSALTKLTVVPGSTPELVEAVIAEIPVAKPKLSLQRPVQLVTTAGVNPRGDMDLDATLNAMRELSPVARALGFTAVESYVRWNFVEPERDRFDWSFYDAIVKEAQRHHLQWFPLLIVGSAYALPPWFKNSEENAGFVCLEHGERNNIQTIFADIQRPHVERFMKAFGAHYGGSEALLGVRLGPSGNYGESQYPAGGNWGYGGEREHIHIGWWAGDEYAAEHFQRYLRSRYPDIASLNVAWDASYARFEDVQPFVAQFAETPRKRKDFVDWYVDAMTDWCEDWAVWARNAMPDTDIYQSTGGWGFVESGTDFTDQTRSMAKVHGGIRATNETDSYAQNFYATRMMTSAARFYGIPFGSEPAGYGSARGVLARLYNIIVNNGQHLFYYHSNLLANDQAVDKWLTYAPLLDQRDHPFVEVAALYPDTMSKLDDALFRNLYAFTFNRQVAALRPKLDFDFCSERMVFDGALSRYKALMLLWNPIIEEAPLNAIDAWVRDGGTLLIAQWRSQPVETVEGDQQVFRRWQNSDTGSGKVVFVPDDREPSSRMANAMADALLALDTLDPRTHQMLQIDKPDEVYVSLLRNGSWALLNYNDRPVQVAIPSREPIEMDAYSIVILPISDPSRS